MNISFGTHFKNYLLQPAILFYSVLMFFALGTAWQTGYVWQVSLFLPVILLLSPFTEYFVHKYVLHLPLPAEAQRHPWWQTIMEHIHYRHHQDPKDPTYIVAQTWLTAPSLVLYSLVCVGISGSWGVTGAFAGSLIGYYLLYEWTHYTAHVDYIPITAYGRYMKKYHTLHHYKNENYWYGITSPLADMVFGKFVPVQAVPVSDLARHNREHRQANTL